MNPLCRKRTERKFNNNHLPQLVRIALVMAIAAMIITAGPAAANTMCVDVTVSTHAALEAAIVDYNANCGNGDTLTATVDGTVTLTSALSAVNNTTTAVLEIVGDGDDILDGDDNYQILYITDGEVTIDMMTLQNGSASQGGAILNDDDGTLTVTNSTFTSNSASSSGAIRNNGTLTITNSTFYNNTATGFDGGAIDTYGVLNITNSTFTGNYATRDAGAIYHSAGSITLTNSTISDNSADGTQSGGIIKRLGTMTLNNTILANNTINGGSADCYRTVGASAVDFSTGTTNLIENDSSDRPCDNTGTQTINVDPDLGSLADNGGDVLTMLPDFDSPVINIGDASTAPADDARGISRPQGTADDLGAVEVEAPACQNYTVTDQADMESVIAAYNVNCGNGDTLTATMDGTVIYTDDPTTINNTTTAVLEIVGDGDDILDGDDNYQILNITDGEVSIDTMTLQNGDAGSGGAIFNDDNGTVTVTDSTFTGNSATGGGAIRTDGDMTITNSTIANNSANQDAAGIYNFGTLEVINTTITGNSARRDGGGIYADNSGTMTATNNTIADNSAGGTTSGGLVIEVGNTVTLNNNIIANNTLNGSPNDCYRFTNTTNFSSGTTNLIENDSSTNSCGTAGSNYITDDPQLGSLADNGGPVQTMELLIGSPAIDVGDASTAPAEDARGISRPQFVADDLGAYEIDDLTPAIRITIDSDSISENGGVSTATVSRNSNSGSLTVNLSSNDTGEATVPASVTIADGESVSSSFNVTAVDDSLDDGTQTVTITASASSYSDVTDTIDITDDDDPLLTVTIDSASISENGGVSTATVSRNSTSGSLTVNLSSNDTGEATVPANVIIAAGQTTSPSFNVTAVNDGLADDTQTVTITASATGFTDATDTIDITPGCGDVTVANQTELEIAITTYNTDCGNGDSMTITVNGTITLASALSVINNATTAQLTITDGTLNGAGSFRILELTNGDVTIDTMTLLNGSAVAGGAIEKLAGTLTITNSTFSINNATGTGNGGGGAIRNNSGLLSVSSSTFSGNTSTGSSNDSGGAIDNTGTLTITSSIFSSNTASGTSSEGGAIVNSGTLTVTNSTFSGNRATAGNGGAISVGGNTTLISSTLTENEATTGGAIYQNSSTMTITASKILSNTASDNGGAFFMGSGATTYLTVSNSCIVYNSDTAAQTDNTNHDLSATGNWWGAENGPSGQGPGGGDSVSNYVDYSGYLTAPLFNCPTYPKADLEISKSVDPSNASPGDSITYTISFINNGPAPAVNVIITDTLPISLSNLGYDNSGPVVTSTGSVSYTWLVDDLDSGESGVITVTGQVVDNIPASNFTNTAIITTITTVDSNTLNNEAEAGLTVLNVSPVLTAVGNQTIIETYALTFTVTANDDNGDSLSYSLSGEPTGASINPSSGLFSWTPTEAQGPDVYTFTIIVSDTDNLTDSEEIVVTVLEEQTAPVLALIGNQTITETDTLTFTASATDADLPVQSLSYSLSGEPTGASINPSSGLFSWTPTEAQGPDVYTFTVIVSDTDNLTDSEEIVVTVLEEQTAPVLALIGNQTITETDTLTFTASATDADLPIQNLTYSLSGEPAGASIDSSSGLFSWTPTEAQGPDVYTFTVIVSDTDNLTDSEEIVVTVVEEQIAPVLAVIGNQTITETDTLTFTANATDADLPAQSLTYSLSGEPAGASINPSSGLFSWTPTEAQGPDVYTFTVIVSDTDNLTDSEEIVVTVLEEQGTPVLALIGNQTITETNLFTFTANATDADLPAQSLTYSLSGEPAGASIDPSSGLFSWTPTEVQGPGTYTFTVIVSDTDNLTDSEEIVVTVNEVNSTPQFTSTPVTSVTVGAIYSYTVVTTDQDVPGSSSDLIITLINAPTWLSLTDYGNGTALLTGPPNNSDIGDHTITLQVSDGVLTTTQTFTLSVQAGDIFLPIILNNDSAAPDLVVDNLVADSNTVTVTIRNAGGATSDAFWVDVYFNPNPAPPGLNQPWDAIAPAGAVWGVTKSLAQDETLVLTTGGAYYSGPPVSSPTFPVGATVYVYVDSINYDTNYGNVQESNEGNNLMGPVLSTADASTTIIPMAAPISQEGLPQR